MRAQTIIEEASGRSPTLYRPPYGVLNAAALAHARRSGWRTLLWSHWGRDWEARATAESIAARLTDGADAGSVLLLHDADDYSAPSSWRRTVAALPRVLETLAAAGPASCCAVGARRLTSVFAGGPLARIGGCPRAPRSSRRPANWP